MDREDGQSLWDNRQSLQKTQDWKGGSHPSIRMLSVQSDCAGDICGQCSDQIQVDLLLASCTCFTSACHGLFYCKLYLLLIFSYFLTLL